MKKKTIALITLLSAISVTASAVTIDFDSNTEFDNNFVVLSGSDALYRTTISSGTIGVVRKDGSGLRSAIYDTSATGGSNGQGGTSGSGADPFLNATVSVNMRFSNMSGPSLGLWARTSSDYTSAYLGLVNYISSSEIRLRIYDSNSNPSTGGVGTLLFDESIDTGDVVINTNTFYTLSFTTKNKSASEVELSIAFSTVDGELIGGGSVIDTTTPVLTAGQTGFRANSQIIYIDQYSVSVIPEVSTVALLMGALCVGVLLLRRRPRG